MANTISKYAIEYVNSQEVVRTMFDKSSLFADLIKPLVSHKGKTISYDQLDVSGEMGTFNRETGYPEKGITMTRLEKTLSQDRGDSLHLDAMDKDEAQIEGGIVRLYNNYVEDVEIPTFDAYVAAAIAAYNANTESVHGELGASTILGKLIADCGKLSKRRVKLNQCILYISYEAKALLDEVALTKAVFTTGNWNGNLDSTVEMFKGAKVVPCALPEGVDWVIAHPLSADAFIVNEDATFFEQVPNYGSRRKQVDCGLYFDCFVREVKGIVVGVPTTRASA